MSQLERSPSRTSLKLPQLLQLFPPLQPQSTSRTQKLQPSLRTELAQSCQPHPHQMPPTAQPRHQESLTTRVLPDQTSRSTVLTARTDLFLLKMSEANILQDLRIKDQALERTSCLRNSQEPLPKEEDLSQLSADLSDQEVADTMVDTSAEEKLLSFCYCLSFFLS